MELRILDERIGTEFDLPKFATEGSAGLDIRAMLHEELVLHPRMDYLIPSGIALSMDYGIAGLLIPRSSWGIKGLVLTNSVGLIDSDYQGMIRMMCRNLGENPIIIQPGDRIMQILFVDFFQPTLEIVDKFSKETGRNIGGFGSTG